MDYLQNHIFVVYYTARVPLQGYILFIVQLILFLKKMSIKI